MANPSAPALSPVERQAVGVLREALQSLREAIDNLAKATRVGRKEQILRAEARLANARTAVTEARVDLDLTLE